MHGDVRADHTRYSYIDIVAGGFLKAALFHFQPVRSGNEVQELILAGRAGMRLVALTGSSVSQRHGHAMERATGRIVDRADERSVKRLAVSKESENRDDGQDNTDSGKILRHPKLLSLGLATDGHGQTRMGKRAYL